LVIATPFILSLLLALVSVFNERLPGYIGLIIGLTSLCLWVVFLIDLAKISKILLLRRSITEFPKCSLAIGGVSLTLLICVLLLTIMWPFFYFGIREAYIPLSSDAFRVSYRAKIIISESDIYRLKEHYEINPQGSYTVVNIEEIESG